MGFVAAFWVVGSITSTLLPFAASSREGSGGLTWLLSSEFQMLERNSSMFMDPKLFPFLQ